MKDERGISRRDFVKMLGGGVVAFVSFGRPALLAQDGRMLPEDVNAFLRIGKDGRVTVFSGKIEMGQGVMTSLAQMAAEDLRVPLESIDMIMGDTDLCPWDRGTFGSLTTRMFGPAMRAAAAARTVLLKMASARLGVPREQLVVHDGVVSVPGQPAKKVGYGELVKGRQISRLVGEKAVLRSAKEFTVMGTSPTRLDAFEKVTGRARFAADVRRPGMLHARILRPPAHGAKLRSLGTSAAEAVPGTRVVNRDGLVAVLHPDPEGAAATLAKLEADWEMPKPQVDNETIFEHLMKAAPAPEVVANRGDVGSAQAATTRVFESTYRKGYVAHAPIEPHAAIAEMKDGRMTVWAGTQTPFPAQESIAEELGLKKSSVRVITPFVGGGFGGKSRYGQAVEAARLAQITGKPVQVAWTRGEEFFYDTFDPAAVVKIVSAINDEGRITHWDYGVYAAGARGSALFYDVPNVSIRTYGGWRSADLHPFATGAWRAPGANANVWAMESQIDLMAAAAKMDPLEFRLRNTKDERMQRVLKAAAEKFGWQPAAAPSGQGRAIACGIDAGSYVALAARVNVEKSTGRVRVDRIVCAQDMGLVVNPTGATMQVEGCITMGLGYVFSEELRFEGGKILDSNFGTYELARFSQVPRIDTVLVKNDELAPQGGGEPAIVPMGAVVANALFDATGVRMFRLPITPARVLAALNEAARPNGHPRADHDRARARG